MGKAEKWFGRLVSIGILLNLCFALPAMFAPDMLLAGLDLAPEASTLWLQNIRMLLLSLSVYFTRRPRLPCPSSYPHKTRGPLAADRFCLLVRSAAASRGTRSHSTPLAHRSDAWRAVGDPAELRAVARGPGQPARCPGGARCLGRRHQWGPACGWREGSTCYPRDRGSTTADTAYGTTCCGSSSRSCSTNAAGALQTWCDRIERRKPPALLHLAGASTMFPEKLPPSGRLAAPETPSGPDRLSGKSGWASLGSFEPGQEDADRFLVAANRLPCSRGELLALSHGHLPCLACRHTQGDSRKPRPWPRSSVVPAFPLRLREQPALHACQCFESHQPGAPDFLVRGACLPVL